MRLRVDSLAQDMKLAIRQLEPDLAKQAGLQTRRGDEAEVAVAPRPASTAARTASFEGQAPARSRASSGRIPTPFSA